MELRTTRGSNLAKSFLLASGEAGRRLILETSPIQPNGIRITTEPEIVAVNVRPDRRGDCGPIYRVARVKFRGTCDLKERRRCAKCVSGAANGAERSRCCCPNRVNWTSVDYFLLSRRCSASEKTIQALNCGMSLEISVCFADPGIYVSRRRA